jgi:drug/metabolite transporter (DMT)-like permease
MAPPSVPTTGVVKTLALTSLAMLAFAGNSLLCRFALADGSIDAASFTTIRLAAGALVLLLVAAVGRSNGAVPRRGNWPSASMLFLYAICFSLAYDYLTASTGALVLFSAVQFTMLLMGVREGERPGSQFWVGFILALGGLIYLLSPGIEAPPPAGAASMAVAGIAWGIYSLRGRGAGDPLAPTRDNFVLSVPLALAASAVLWSRMHLTAPGVALAAISGGITSGLGYVIWYAALKGLGATRAAIVQLSVPAITALGAVLLLAEPLSVRLLISSAAILGGIAIALRFHRT